MTVAGCQVLAAVGRDLDARPRPRRRCRWRSRVIGDRGAVSERWRRERAR